MMQSASSLFDNKFSWIGTALAASGIVAVVAFIKVYRYVHEFRNVFKEMGLYELPDKRWIGAWSLYMERKEDLFQLEIDLIKENGKIFGYFEGRQPAMMIADVDLLKHIMLKDAEHFYDRRILIASRKSTMDLVLNTLTGARWKHVRQQLTPAFTPANLRRMEPLLKKVADQLITNIAKRAADGKSFDAKEMATCYTLDAIGSMAFALEIDSFNNPDSPFVSNAKKVFASIPLNGGLVAGIFMFPDFMAWLLGKLPFGWLPIAKMFKFYIQVIENEISRRKQAAKDNEIQRHDFLAQIIPLEKDPKDPANKDSLVVDEFGGTWLRNGLIREEIVAQSVLFFLAGYETTATSLTMTLLALSQNPEIQDRLRQELKAVFEDGKEVNLDALNGVKYLEMVINESLRCYTSVLRIDRICTGDTVYNGMRIPKGVMMVIPVNAIHHDPELWPEPDKFDPERFSSENADRIPPMAFIPFGAGNRNCIGMRLAMLELKLAVARLVLEFKFTLSPETQLPIRWLPTAFRTPANCILLQAEKRITM